MNLELKGLTALVTGASRGIGLAIAHQPALLGCAQENQFFVAGHAEKRREMAPGRVRRF